MKWLACAGLFAMVSVARADETQLVCKVPTGKITATFSTETSIQDLATWVMGLTCKNVVIDAKALHCSAKVAVLAPKPMTTKQALQLFYDAVEATGLVVKTKKDSILVMVDPKSPRACTEDPLTSPSSVPVTRTAADIEAEDELAKLIDGGVTAIDGTHYEVKAVVIDTILANPMALAKGARVVPGVRDGKPHGFKLYAVRPSSIYARVGLANGDTIEKLNGIELTSADKALEVYAKLRDARTLTIELIRRGTPRTITITILR